MEPLSPVRIWKDFSQEWNLSKTVCVFNFATFAIAVSMVAASPRSDIAFITPLLSAITAYSWGYSGLVAAIALVGEAVRNFFFQKPEARSWTLFWWHVGYAAAYASFVGYVMFQILSTAGKTAL